MDFTSEHFAIIDYTEPAPELRQRDIDGVFYDGLSDALHMPKNATEEHILASNLESGHLLRRGENISMKPEPNTSNIISITKAAILAIVIIAIVILGISYYRYEPPITLEQTMQIQVVRNVFLDVNQDGKQDLLVEGHVIFNVPLEMTQPQMP